MPGFDRVAEVYDATRSLRPEVMAEVVGAISARVGGHSVLDLGVGTGRFAVPLARAGAEVVGLDISPKMAGQASEKGLRNLVLADAKSAPFGDRSFDHVLVVHFLHLVDDWRAVVREIARVAKSELLTVLEDPEGTKPRDLYITLREARGYPMRGLKDGEHELAGMLRPTLKREVVSYTEVFDPDRLLSEYASKLHSVTWDVPDSVNAEIVEEMGKRLGARREQDRSFSLVAWDTDRLLELRPSA